MAAYEEALKTIFEALRSEEVDEKEFLIDKALTFEKQMREEKSWPQLTLLLRTAAKISAKMDKKAVAFRCFYQCWQIVRPGGEAPDEFEFEVLKKEMESLGLSLPKKE